MPVTGSICQCEVSHQRGGSVSLFPAPYKSRQVIRFIINYPTNKTVCGNIPVQAPSQPASSKYLPTARENTKNEMEGEEQMLGCNLRYNCATINQN